MPFSFPNNMNNINDNGNNNGNYENYRNNNYFPEKFGNQRFPSNSVSSRDNSFKYSSNTNITFQGFLRLNFFILFN